MLTSVGVTTLRRSRLSKSPIIHLLLVLLLFATIAKTASAQPATPPATPVAPGSDRISKAFEFYPADSGFGTFFAPRIEAGSSVELTVLIANTGDETQDLRTYAINAFTAAGGGFAAAEPVSYTHLRAHETVLDLVCR